MKLLITFILIVFLSLYACAQTNTKQAKNIKALSPNLNIAIAIDSIMKIHSNAFSGVLLVADKNKVIYHKAFGYRDFAQKIPLQKDDVFQIASIAKTFTAMMVLMLKEKGKVDLDDPVEKHLTIPYKGMTIRHLLSHTSGLPDFPNIMEKYADKTRVTSNDDVLLYLNKWSPPVLSVPGTKWEYDNTGYILLASLVEKVTGENFEKISRKWIFKPLQMRNTRILSANKKRTKNFTSGHVYVPARKQFVRADSLTSANVSIYQGKKGPNNANSTTEDLLKWDQALYTEKLVKASTLQQAFTQYKLPNDLLTNYGLGWRIFSHPQLGKKVLHTGITPGYRNRFIRYVDQKKTIILLSNNAYENVDEIVKQLEKILAQ